ncbi:MAG: acetylornithine/succinylornithine family transaminase [Oscillospiraceae bacterium]|jgi:acetylornithine/N-succinyldiaminopimelate aminotransferase|nr:acetylornithine/succinylornithine family transaminase [Oscillospiraceae bacterium]
MSELKTIDKEYVANTYARFPVEPVSGKGSLVWDEAGKEYIDMGSGIGVTAFGIADDAWVAAVTEQLGKLQHMSNLYYTEPCAMLAKMLCERSGMKKVFFCNSGAEANEGAIKAARKYAAEKKGPEYYTIVTLENSFHGRTLTTLAATGQDHYHELFQPLTPGFVHAPANDLEAVKNAALQAKAAAVMIECVQGEGGVIPMEKAFVQGLADFCKKEDILLLVDEVQTGNGRTGELYAYMNFGVQPDVVSTAKGLGGGLPLGAVLFGEKTEFTLGAGDHGSTFGGNPVCCAGALSVLGRIDDQLLKEVKEKSAYIFKTLEGAPGVESVSGMGLMIGIKTAKPAGDVVKTCMENGVLCLTAKDKVRLLPALNIPMPVLEKAIEVIKGACV